MKWLRFIPLLLLPSISSALPVVSVYFSTSAPANAESTLLSMTTNQWLGVLTQNTSPLFPNSWTFTLQQPNPNFIPTCGSCCPAPAPPIYDTTTLPSIVQNLTNISTWTYVYGYADGQQNTRDEDIGYASTFQTLCTSTSTFYISGSTSVFNVHIDTATCYSVLGTLETSLYQILTSTPEVITVPPQGY